MMQFREMIIECNYSLAYLILSLLKRLLVKVFHHLLQDQILTAVISNLLSTSNWLCNS